MAFSLYDASVANYLQILGGVSGFLERGSLNSVKRTSTRKPWSRRGWRRTCSRCVSSISPSPNIPARLEAAQSGRISSASFKRRTITPDCRRWSRNPRGPGGLDAGRRQCARRRDVVFLLGDHKLPFTTEGFFMSFSLTQLLFPRHTAYDILRTMVALGKRDFMGRLKMRSERGG